MNTSEGTVMDAKQTAYCSFCRINHKKWKKHVYSKRHQEVMKKILQKFGSKVSTAVNTSDQPLVEDVTFERGAKVWCYFCAEDIDKHTHADTYTVKYGAFIDHISSDNHLIMANKFLHSNLLDTKQLNELVVDAAQFKNFQKNATLAVMEYQSGKFKEMMKEADNIRTAEQQRRELSNRVESESEDKPVKIDGGRTSVRPSNLYRKILSAKGEGVTSILQTSSDVSGEGNIFSGAVPPWLRPDSEPHSSGGVIGPTMEDYQKYKEREKKKKLPANRVGARFDHTAETSDRWLPSFGRVWSKGRRLQSKNYFERKTGRGGFGKGTMTRKLELETESTPVTKPPRNIAVQPYQRKRSATATVTSSGLHQSERPNCSYSESASGDLGFLRPPTQRLVGSDHTADVWQASLTPSAVVRNHQSDSSPKYTSIQVPRMIAAVSDSDKRTSSIPLWKNSRPAVDNTTNSVTLPIHSSLITPYKRKRPL